MDIEENDPEIADEEVESESSEDSVTAVYPITEIEAHSDSVCSVSFHPTNHEIYSSGGIDDIAYLYIGAEVKELSGFTDSVIVVTFSPCGEYLAIGSMDGSVSVHETVNGDKIATYQGPTEEILTVSWHPRLPSICVLSSDLSLWIWHIRKNSPVAVIYGHPLSVAKFAPFGRFIYAGGKDGSLKIWDMKVEEFSTLPPYWTLQGNEIHTDEVICTDMHSSGIIITGSKDGTAALTNVNSKRLIHKWQICEESVESVEFCKEMLWFLVASMNGEFKVFECDSLSARCTVNLGSGIVKAMWVGMEIYVCGTEAILQCFDGRNGVKKRKYKGPTEIILDFDVKFGKIIAGCEDHRVFIWKNPENE